MITVSFKDMAAPVTDEERAKMTYLVNNMFDKHPVPDFLTINERGLFVLATLYKEAQDALYEVSKGGI